MKAFCLVCLILTLPTAASAAPASQYFNGKDFEEFKPVQMIGTIKTPDDSEREKEIGRVVAAAKNQLSFCYLRELSNVPLMRLESIIYFTVDADGRFKNLTADMTGPKEINSRSRKFMRCAITALSQSQASANGEERAFRFRASFSESK